MGFPSTKYIEYNPSCDEYYISFTDEELKELGWYENDTVIWTDNGDNSFSLKKKDDSPT